MSTGNACLASAPLTVPHSRLLSCRRARAAQVPPPPSAKGLYNWDTVKAQLMSAPASTLRVELVDGTLAELRDYQIKAWRMRIDVWLHQECSCGFG